MDSMLSGNGAAVRSPRSSPRSSSPRDYVEQQTPSTPDGGNVLDRFSFSDTSIEEPQIASPRAISPRTTEQHSMVQHIPPDASALLATVKPSFFETSPEDFDEKLEALSGLGGEDATSNVELLERLLSRVEEIDLARDVVTNSLANEVRRSSTSLLSGMRQVQDLDLDVTRTSLHAGAIRRRLALAKKNLFEAELRVSRLSVQRDKLKSMQGHVAILVEVGRLKRECNAVVSPLSACIEAVLQTRDRLERDYPHAQLRAIRSSIDALNARIPKLEATVLLNVKTSLRGPSLDEARFADSLVCLEKLQWSLEDQFNVVKRLWQAMLELYLTAPSIGKALTDKTFSYREDESILLKDEDVGTPSSLVVAKSPFVRVSDCCAAFVHVLSHFASTSLPSSSITDAKQEAVGTLAKLTDDYLKSPLVRSQVLDEFAQTIEDSSRLVDRTDGWFSVPSDMDSSQYFNKTRMESSIRLRARVYAQQYQAEGFQAMRGLLWRESWVDVASGSASNVSPSTMDSSSADFVEAIFTRLGLSARTTATSTTTTVPSKQSFVITATMGSGLPRQIQRTLDLMRKLPASAAGEAFLGLLRIIDLYLLAALTTFVPSDRFFRSKQQMRTVGHIYMSQARESLGEWLATSPRHAAPHPPTSPSKTIDALSSDDESELKLCEFEFLDDPDRSFEPALVAAESLDFLLFLIAALEKPLSDLLPAVERVKLAAKMFVELPQVVTQVKQLVRRSAVERLEARCVFPNLMEVYEGETMMESGPADSFAQFASFNDCIYEMQVVFQQNVSNPHLSDPARVDLWDDCVALFFDKYVDAIAAMPRCSAMDRGNMIMHLASFWEHLNQIPGSRQMLAKIGSSASSSSAKSRQRADDFVKAFYYDKAPDLWDWMKRKKEDFEPHHFLSVLETGLVGQGAGATMYISGGSGIRAVGGKAQLRQEFDRLMGSIFG